MIANYECVIIFLTLTVKGSRHDKKIADEAEYIPPEGSRFLQDAGFQDFKIENVSIIQPVKKPKGMDLTPDEKEGNRNISKIRRTCYKQC